MHLDLWANNLLQTPHWLGVVDFEFSARGQGWYDLASVSLEGGLDEPARVELLHRLGRPGDAEDLRAIGQGIVAVHLFEGLWATIMDAHRVSKALQDEPFDYAGHAARTREKLLDLLADPDLLS